MRLSTFSALRRDLEQLLPTLSSSGLIFFQIGLDSWLGSGNSDLLPTRAMIVHATTAAWFGLQLGSFLKGLDSQDLSSPVFSSTTSSGLNRHVLKGFRIYKKIVDIFLSREGERANQSWFILNLLVPHKRRGSVWNTFRTF
jgi:hypothetical protein